MLLGELFSVCAEPTFDQVAGKVADVVTPNATGNEAQLFKVAAVCDALFSEVAKDRVQVGRQGGRELFSKATACVTVPSKAEPIMFDLAKPVPGVNEIRRHRALD